MIIASEERKSQGPLIAFIDLLFLLVAFFILLLFFIEQARSASQQQVEAMQEELGTVQQSLSSIVGEEVDVREAVKRIQPMVERFMEMERRQQARQRELAEQEARRAQRTTVRVEYTVRPDGTVAYEGRIYTLAAFAREVLAPLREEHWVSLRAHASPDTAYGTVVHSRAVLLKGRTEFDTYWDNVKRDRDE